MRRRKIFINRAFQGRFFALYTLFVLLAMGFNAWYLVTVFDRQVETQLFSSHLKISSPGDLLHGFMLRISLITAVGVVVLNAVLTFFVFSRLNAHLFRLQTLVQRLGSGRISEQGRGLGIRGFRDIEAPLVEADPMYHGERLQMKSLALRCKQALETENFEEFSVLSGEIDAFLTGAPRTLGAQAAPAPSARYSPSSQVSSTSEPVA